MPDYIQGNLKRLLATAGLSVQHVAEKCGLDERTIRGILNGTNKPHARSLYRLAQGLGVSVDEFFIDPSRLLYRQFDHQTNPVVQNILETYPELFDSWRPSDFEELHSRLGTGGPLTNEGTLAAVRNMNRRHKLHEKLDLLMESSQADFIGGVIDLAYQKISVQ